jgi:hypothetical protein
MNIHIATTAVAPRAPAEGPGSGLGSPRHELHHFTGEHLGNSRGKDIFHDFECMGPRWGATTFSFSQ